MHRQEAYNLLRHLWTFQPTYVSLSEKELISQIKEEVADVSVPAPSKPAVGKQTTQGEFGGRWGELSQNIQNMEEHEVADLSIGEKSRQKALAIREMNTATLARMQEQAGASCSPLPLHSTEWLTNRTHREPGSYGAKHQGDRQLSEASRSST